MNPQQKLNLVFSFIIIGLISTVLFISLSGNKTVNKHSDINNIKEFQLMEVNQQKDLFIDGLITATTIEEVQMKVSGKIDKNNRSLSVGSRFKKNEILIKVERLDALYDLLAARSAYKTLIQALIPQIKEKIPKEEEKWKLFESKIQRTVPLPELPALKSKNEEELVYSLNVISQYYKTKKVEKRAEEYFYLAPFDGTIIESNIGKGISIQSGKTVLKLAKNNSYQVTAQVHLNDLKRIKSKDTIQFHSVNKEIISEGMFSKTGYALSDSSMVEVYLSIFSQDLSLLNQVVQITYPAKKVAVPLSAIKNDSVSLFSSERIYKLSIKTIQKDKDSALVDGIPEHSHVIINP
jgi:hypothetical protein